MFLPALPLASSAPVYTCCLQRFHSRPQSLHLILAILIILLLRGGILLVALPFRRISLPFGRTANGNKRAHTRRSIHHLLLLPRLVPLPPLFIAPLRPRVLPRGALLALAAVLLRAAVLQRRERQLDVVDARLRVRRRRLHVCDLRRLALRRSPHPRKFRLQRAHLPAHLTRLARRRFQLRLHALQFKRSKTISPCSLQRLRANALRCLPRRTPDPSNILEKAFSRLRPLTLLRQNTRRCRPLEMGHGASHFGHVALQSSHGVALLLQFTSNAATRSPTPPAISSSCTFSIMPFTSLSS
ncbi:unnamed protein product, partial [Closterium sp. NIES-54]